MKVKLRKRNTLLLIVILLTFSISTEIIAQKNKVVANKGGNQSKNQDKKGNNGKLNDKIFNGIVYNVVGGGILCEKDSSNVYLDGSENDVLYRLYLDGKRWGPTRRGAGDTLVYRIQKPGTYTIEANKPGYSGDLAMNGNAVFVEGTKIKQLVLHGDSSNNELDLWVKKSEVDISYQLEIDNKEFGEPMFGNNNSIYWNDLKLPGEYKVYATNDVGCKKYMHKSYVLEGNPVPVVYNVIGGGEICEGDSVSISLTGSQIGFSYQLLHDTVPYLSPVSGTDAVLTWNNIRNEGLYSIEAINGFGDKFSMADSVGVTVNSLPEIFDLSGEGEYCENDTNIAVILNTSILGISYELLKNGVGTGTTINGSGDEIRFSIDESGFYSVLAENTSTGCIQRMNDSIEIIINPLPTVYELTGGGEVCVSGPGLPIKLSDSEEGINYILYDENTQVNALLGTGGELEFGDYMSGEYTVTAIDTATNCEIPMNGEVEIKITYIPGTPDSLQLSEVTAISAILGWMDNSCNEKGFEIYRSNALDEDFLLVKTVGDNIATYKDDDLYPNRTYFYKIRAFNDSSYSDYSNVAMTTTLSLTSFVINTEDIITPFNYNISGTDVNSAIAYNTGGVEDFTPDIGLQEMYTLTFAGQENYKELIISLNVDSSYCITNITITVDGEVYPLSATIYKIENKNILKLKEHIKSSKIPDFQISGMDKLVYHSGDLMEFSGLENYPSAILNIYNANKILVKTSADLTWDGTNSEDLLASPGTYLYEIIFQNISETKINGQFIVK